MGAGRGAAGLELLSGNTAREVTPFIRRFRWVESLIRGGFFWEASFATEQWTEWERLLVGRESPARQWRLKSTEGDSVQALEQTTGWRSALVDGSAMRVVGAALVARVWGGDARLTLAQKARVRAWPSSTVAEVVRRIAGEYGLVAVVQDTAGRHDRVQCRESDWTFLMRISREAASSSGRGDLYLWVDEDALHLGAPELARPAERRHDLSEVENRVDGLELRYHGAAVDRLGGATAVGVGYAWEAQDAIVFEMGAEAASTQPALANRVPRAQGGGLRSFAVMKDESAVVEEVARGVWGRAAPRYFQMRLTTRPDLTLRPGSVIEVQATLDARRESPFFGRFVVLEVEHLLVKGNLRTTLSCYRREAFEGAAETTGASVQNLGSRDRERAGGQNTGRGRTRVEVIE